jgi:hypothetical protein
MLSARAIPGAAALDIDLLRQTDDELPEHSDTGPSAAGRLFYCPGSLRVIRWLREQGTEDTSSPDSDRGTMLHACAAGILRDGAIGDHGLSSEDMVAVLVYLDTCARASKVMGTAALHLVEERIDLRDCGAGHGTVDYAILVPGDRGVLVDAKFGARAVAHPRHNWQAILYGHGLCRGFGLRDIELVICRPAADPDWQVMRWETTAEELADLARRYHQQVLTAQGPDAPLVCGDHCVDTFCPAKAVCPARWACAAQVPRHGDWRAWLATVDSTARRNLLERARIAAQQFSAFAAEIEEAAIADPVRYAVDGYGITSGRGRRVFMDTLQAVTVLQELLRTKGKDPDAAWTAREVISPAQAEKLLGKSAGIAARLNDLITTTPGKPALKKGA